MFEYILQVLQNGLSVCMRVTVELVRCVPVLRVQLDAIFVIYTNHSQDTVTYVRYGAKKQKNKKQKVD